MALKTASVTLEGDDLRFVGRTGSGHALVLDSATGDTGMRPAELVPLALAGCTAMDVISILRKKRQDVHRYEVEAKGSQEDGHPNTFTRIDVVHVVEGTGIDVEAVRRAIELSATKYCSVGATLSSGLTEVHHAYVVRDDAVDGEQAAEVIVLGPWATAAEAASLAAAGCGALPWDVAARAARERAADLPLPVDPCRPVPSSAMPVPVDPVPGRCSEGVPWSRRSPSSSALPCSPVSRPVTGVLMVLGGLYSFETGWIAAAIVLYVITAIVGVALYGPAIRRQLAEAERDPSSADYAAAERRSNLLGAVTFLIVAVIVVLMVTKPF